MTTHPSRILILADEKPLPVERELMLVSDGLEFIMVNIRDGTDTLWTHATAHGINPDLLENLADGDTYRMPHPYMPSIQKKGRLRMLWGYQNNRLQYGFLEFLPDAGVPTGLDFHAWRELRFPKTFSHSSPVLSEEWIIHLLPMWAEETSPPTTISPDDPLLMEAVENCMADLVEAILSLQPQIVATPESQRAAYNNALHLAIIRTQDGPAAWGSFAEIVDDSEEPGDDKHDERRIVKRLRAAGAVDYRPLLSACRTGDVQNVERMLESGFPPNFGAHALTTPLLQAVKGGHLAVCEALLRHGADPDLNQSVDDYEICEYLNHPLKAAVDHPEIFTLLIESGVDPSTCDEDGRSLVFRGNYASRKHAEAIFGLVDFGAIRGYHGRSGVHFLNARDLALCWDFVPQELVNRPDSTSLTPLLDAIYCRDTAKALYLLEQGADPMQPCVVWMSQGLDIDPPHFRPSKQLQHLLDLTMGLIDTMPDEEPGNANQLPDLIVTPIQMALLRQNIEIVEKLLDLGAKPGPKALALYPYREAVRNAKDGILARLAEEPSCTPRIKIDPPAQFQYMQEYVEPAGQVAHVLLRDPRKAIRYPEMVEELDLLRWADYEYPHPAVVEPFRTGRKLSPAGWLDFTDQALDRVNHECDDLARKVADDAGLGTHTANGSFVLEALDHAESTWMQVRLRITGQPPQRLSLSTEACERALGTFDNRKTRTTRALAQSSHSECDDFTSGIDHPLPRGTSIDLTQLVQAVRMITKRLKRHCAKLRKAI